MTFEEFSALPPDHQCRIVQSVYPLDENDPLFVGIKAAFLKAYPKCAQAERVILGEGPGFGGFNVIGVRTKPGVRLRLPKRFMGLEIIRSSVGRSGWWVPA